MSCKTLSRAGWASPALSSRTRWLYLRTSASQVKDLLDRWSALRQQEESISAQESEPEPGGPDPESSSWPPPPQILQKLDYDAHFPAPYNDDNATIFFGSSSAQVLSTEVLAVVCPQSPLLQQPPRQSERSSSMQEYSPYFGNEPSNIVPTKALILRLLDIYARSCMGFWPFHLDCLGDDDIDVFFQSTQGQVPHSQAYTKSEAHSNFQIGMMCCIASAHSSRVEATMRAYEQFFYSFASKLTKEVLSEASHDSLRSLMLLVVYLLFRPQNGDLWLQLESACRLAIELGYHRENAPFTETPVQRAQRGDTFWTLYRLEHSVAEIYGRPSDDLESISTIEISHVTATLTTSPTQSRLLPSANLASSLAKLSRIRSYIFKTIYLPARSAPIFIDDPYYRTQLHEIEQWRQEATAGVTDPLASVACTIAYNTSVIFLLQKSLLQVLSRLAEPVMDTPTLVGAIAVQSFESAVELISCYEDLILSEGSLPLADFPVTFISAQEVSLAALTFVSWLFCSLDGRVKQEDLAVGEGKTLMQRSWVCRDGSLSIKGQGRRLQHLSASCLSLLTWYAIQWPGMDGMVEIYREISAEVFHEAAARGLA
ncbi:hypothetical protein A1O1_04705 [Capronia coronata CBS 617.96]|uniref:Xylanolytic transcriptional activator regulatory domain-containing protein n=1 Tax=Capronia coronata CBS 617.96 TaxID=1182541 RepID=W9Y5H1_9EURO|nr:uncharacterized protein A1O1_04705 [Capronia coronata CBS 617.96]EXJ87778.1 hypothetical protein A1O1_04705 [Capronia coronata CBS 617.96]